ncbi:hypothetical protein [Paraliomyxa miuraensis]|uniref:hypothetical protein n=1 Tax=Paraliomyxa miuraensis TaxID=376150 RepID=UPI002256E35D|nr:hypothetical protein [Paraliomyxa miuraensis]MCX4244724.1 hypothetical protein [Paraliomyxa miuraensis]
MLEERIASLRRELAEAEATLAIAVAERDYQRQRLGRAQERTEPRPYTGPAVSRWRRRPGGGPRGIRVHDDFDEPLPEFEDY